MLEFCWKILLVALYSGTVKHTTDSTLQWDGLLRYFPSHQLIQVDWVKLEYHPPEFYLMVNMWLHHRVPDYLVETGECLHADNIIG